MYEHMILHILWITIIIILIIWLFKNKSSNLIDMSKYPEIQTLIENKEIIIQEMKQVMKLKLWARWAEYDKINETPIFSQMTHEEIIKHMNNNNSYLNEGPASWRIFGLMLSKQIINADLCPKTTDMLKKIPYIINAGFSCLEPGVSTSWHKGYNKNIYRCHLPLIVPNGDCAIKINDEIVKCKINNDFIFDDTNYHQAWNYTNESRFVLIIDISNYRN